MIRIVYGGLALGFFLLALLFQMPGTLLAQWLDVTTHQRLSVEGVGGSVWSGKARVACVRLDRSTERCGDWQWQFVPRDLFEGKFRWKLKGASSAESVVVVWTVNGLQLESLALSLPAFLVGDLDPKLAALQLGGRLRIDGKQLSSKEGRADVTWTNMSSRLAPGVDLGDLSVNLVANPKGWAIALSSGPGALSVSGEGQLNRQNQLSLRASAAVALAAERTRLAPFLGLLGAESAPGVFSVQLP